MNENETTTRTRTSERRALGRGRRYEYQINLHFQDLVPMRLCPRLRLRRLRRLTSRPNGRLMLDAKSASRQAAKPPSAPQRACCWLALIDELDAAFIGLVLVRAISLQIGPLAQIVCLARLLINSIFHRLERARRRLTSGERAPS